MRVAAIYARGVSAPYTEGHVAVARCMARAIALSGFRTVLLNFKYSTKSHTTQSPANSSPARFDIRVPLVDRDTLFHSPGVSPLIMATLIESTLMPALVARELRLNASVVHLLNSVKLPRMLFRIVSRTPVVSHFCQPPAKPPLLRLRPPIDAVVASSVRIAKILRGRSERTPIFVVPPPIDMHLFNTSTNAKARPKTVLYIGNLPPNRFPNRLLEIFCEIARHDPEVSFRVIAPLNAMNIQRKDELTNISKSLHINDKLTISVRDMSENEKLNAYWNAKCFIFPAIRECQDVIEPPLTVLEALASGLPIVATDTYSVGEAVVPGKNGYLVASDSYMSLAYRTLEVLQADQSEWDRWSIEARKTATENFSMRSTSERLARLHRSLLGN